MRRTSEIEEISNRYLIHPIGGFLTGIFARAGIRPNLVSLTGMAFGIAAGICYFHLRRPGYALAGFLLMLAWHVMDGADGQLARLTGTQSELGKVLDGICDYVTFIAVYCGIGIALARQDGIWVIAFIAFSGLCHAVQSAAYEAQRQAYDFWGWGRGSRPARPAAGAAGWLHFGYSALQRRMSGTPPGFDASLQAALRAAPGGAAILRGRYREVFAAPLRRWSVLSANYRTAAIFLCAALGVPLAYFGLEITVLNLILAVLLARQNRRAEGFLESLTPESPKPRPSAAASTGPAPSAPATG